MIYSSSPSIFLAHFCLLTCFYTFSSIPQLRSQSCHNAAPPLRCVGCCSFVTPEGFFFFLRSPRTALPEPFAARSSPGRGPRAPPRTAPLGAATRAQPAPGAPAPPAPSLLRLERAARGCGQLRRRRAGHSRGSAPCSDGSGGQRPPRGLPEPPCCEGAEGPGRAAGGPAGDGVRREK